MSGAGKTSALHILEDMGYYCVDNIPASLLTTFYTLCSKSDDEMMKHVAVVVDVRGNESYTKMNQEIEEFKLAHNNVKILYLDAKSDVLIIRYEETRRKHPLSEKASGNIKRAVEMEREPLNLIRAKADYVVDTSFIEATQLKARITDLFLEKSGREMRVYCQSFGFKYGSPNEALSSEPPVRIAQYRKW